MANFGDSLKFDKSGEANEQTLRIATIALMIEMARTDHDISEQELGQIMRSMQAVFDMDAAECAELTAVAAEMFKEKESIGQFVDQIAVKFSSDQKQLLLTMVWQVVAADGVADQYETAFAAHLRAKLNLTLEEAVRARQIAESGDLDPFDFEIELSTSED